MTDDHTHRGDDVHSVEAAMQEDNGGWQPIDTAPRSTKAILIHCSIMRNTYAVTWFKPYKSWAIFGGGYLRETATHWMPLPAAPTKGKHLTLSEE